MSNIIKIKRGAESSLPIGGVNPGELKYTIDGKNLYIDDGTNNVLIGGNPSNFPVSTATQTALDLKVDKLGNDKIVIVQTGQSNAVGTGGTYDSGEPADAVDARIFAWTGTKTNANGAWVQATLSGATMGDKVNNGQSMAFHAAKAILAEYPNKQVYIIVSGEGGNYIREWLGQDSNRFKPLDENVKKALRVLGKDKIDLLIWTQGEADKNRTNADYKLDLNYTLFNQLKRTTWFDAQTPFVATALKTGGDDFQNAVLDDYDTDGNIYTAFVDAGISGGVDPLHYDSAGYRTMGALIYTDGLKKIWLNTLGETFVHTDYTSYLYSHYQPKDGTNLLVDRVGNNHGLILGNTVVTDGRLIVTVASADDVSNRVHLSKAHRYSSSQAWTVHFKNTKSRQLSPTLSQGFLLGRYDMGTTGERDYLRLVHTSTYQVIYRNTTQTLTTWTKTEIDAALGSLNMANLHDYSFVADGTGNISLYIDGTLISAKSGMSGGTAFSYNAFAYDSEVEIGETFIFDTAVSATEILKLYTNNDQPVSSTEKANWNAKQDALGFTPENSTNKENTTIDTSTTKYPTVNLLKTGLDEIGAISYANGGEVNKLPNEQVLFDFQSGHGWTNLGTNGTLADDTTDYIFGSQSFSITSDGAGVNVNVRKTGTWDLRNKQFVVWLKVINPANLSTCTLTVYSSTSPTNAYSWSFHADKNVFNYGGEVWIRYALNPARANVFGTIDLANITEARIAVKDNGGGNTCTVKFGRIDTFGLPSEGVVSVVFDDGWKTDYTVAKPELDKYNFKATSYIIPDSIGNTSGIGNITLEEAKKLQASGWQIGAHHQTNLTTLSLAGAEKAMISVKNYLQENGFGDTGIDFAWPNGAYNDNLLQIGKKYFRSLRTIHEVSETLPTADRHRLKILNVTEADTSASVLTAIQKCKAEKSWLIILYHYIDAVPGSIGITPAKFIEQIGYLNSEGMTVKTVKEVLDSDYFVKNEITTKQNTLGYTAENSANKVTTLSGSSTDTQYPSALATYNSIANHNAELTLLQALGSTVKAGNYLAGVSGDSASSLILADGRLHLMAVYLSQPATISEVGWHQITQGDYTADNYNGVGLFTYSGGTLTLVASSTDDGNIWKAAANTYNKKAFSTPYSATAGVYFVGLLYNSSAQVTAPAIARRGTIATNLGSLDLTNSAKIYSYLASSTMPATQAMSGTTASTFAPIIFLH